MLGTVIGDHQLKPFIVHSRTCLPHCRCQPGCAHPEAREQAPARSHIWPPQPDGPVRLVYALDHLPHQSCLQVRLPCSAEGLQA